MINLLPPGDLNGPRHRSSVFHQARAARDVLNPHQVASACACGDNAPLERKAGFALGRAIEALGGCLVRGVAVLESEISSGLFVFQPKRSVSAVRCGDEAPELTVRRLRLRDDLRTKSLGKGSTAGKGLETLA